MLSSFNCILASVLFADRHACSLPDFGEDFGSDVGERSADRPQRLSDDRSETKVAEFQRLGSVLSLVYLPSTAHGSPDNSSQRTTQMLHYARHLIAHYEHTAPIYIYYSDVPKLIQLGSL